MSGEKFWDEPYPSRRSPVLASNVVATSQPLAAQAGVAAIAAGGNAVDAALTAAIALTVVEPTGNGIGSDAFALVWSDGRLHGLNASGRSPRAFTPDRFSGREALPETGWETVTVPGAVDGWRRLSERFGKLPFEKLFQPAVRYARDGFAVSPRIAAAWASIGNRYDAYPEFAQAFLPNGRAPRAGEQFVHRAQAMALEEIARTGTASFYRGELASRMAEHAKRGEAALDERDLSSHSSEWVDPLSIPFGDVTLHEIPPNGQGLAALIAAGILDRLDASGIDPDSADGIHVQVEAMKIGLDEARRHVADPSEMQIGPHELLAPAALDAHAGTIRPDRAAEARAISPTGTDTVCLAAADASGMMVSYIQSNYVGFGSGIVVPGTGISLHNRARGFTLERDHPNEVGGGKRPFHTIMPGFVSRGGAPLVAFGLMGGHMQPQGHLQMLVRIAARGQNPQAASDAPRWQLTEDGALALEPGVARAVAGELERRGHRVVVRAESLFGGAQIVMRLGDGCFGASDHRKDGQAVGY